MKSIGIIRRVDELGRIVIPKEIRNNLKIKEGSEIEIFTEGKSIILKKYEAKTCKSCGTKVAEEDKFCRFCGKEI